MNHVRVIINSDYNNGKIKRALTKKKTNSCIRGTLFFRFKAKGTRSGLQERKLREGRACGGGGIGQNGGERFRGD
jgi:hypothetical protein